MSGISIIIPCYHKELRHYSLTVRCLEHLRKHTKVPFELILIENINKWVANEGNSYLWFKEPKTFAENANIGLKLAKTEYICMLNNDVFVPEGWLEGILKCFDDPLCGIATCDSTQYGRATEDKIVEWFFGAIWVMKRKVFNSVGFFDESFKHAFDDADYWVRVYEAGYKILMNRNIQVEHKDGSTIHKFDGHTERYIAMRKKFNEKHKDCNLQIFKNLR